MLDKPKELLTEVMKSREYALLVSDDSGAYLSSAFTMKEGEWQLDFYSPKRKTLISFRKENGMIKVAEDKIFQQKEQHPEPLVLEDAKISLTEAISKVKEILNSMNEGREEKHIIILQKKDGRILWNITVITASFKVVNVKIDAVSGKIISKKSESLLDFSSSKIFKKGR